MWSEMCGFLYAIWSFGVGFWVQFVRDARQFLVNLVRKREQKLRNLWKILGITDLNLKVKMPKMRPKRAIFLLQKFFKSEALLHFFEAGAKKLLQKCYEKCPKKALLQKFLKQKKKMKQVLSLINQRVEASLLQKF